MCTQEALEATTKGVSTETATFEMLSWLPNATSSRQKSSKRASKKTSEKARTAICELCNKGFPNLASLKVHMFNH